MFPVQGTTLELNDYLISSPFSPTQVWLCTIAGLEIKEILQSQPHECWDLQTCAIILANASFLTALFFLRVSSADFIQVFHNTLRSDEDKE